MRRFFAFFVLMCQLSSVAYSQEPKIRGPFAGGCFLISEKCKPIIKQADWGIEVNGLPIRHDGTVGPIKLNQTLTQKLTNIAQLLDFEQLGRCQDLNRLTTCDKAREFLLKVAEVGRHQLTELAILAQMHSDKADNLEKTLETWIVKSSDQLEKIYSKEFLAAGSGDKERIEKIRDAKKYALAELKVSPDSPEYRELLLDPITSPF